MSKEVFITGSEGFAGSHLKNELRQQGYQVSGTTLSEVDSNNDENIFHCDIRDYKRVCQLISERRPQYIAHLAAYVSPSGSIKNPELTYDINVNGTRNIFEAVRLVTARVANYNPRIIIIGSTEEFGVLPNGSVVTEESPTAPTNPYGQTKLESYNIALEYVSKYGLDIVSAVPSNHTGPGQKQFFAAEIARKIVEIEKGNNKPIMITGDVSNSKNFSDVRDVVRAYRSLLELGVKGERYLVCNNQNVSLSYVVETLLGYSTVKIDHQVDSKRGRSDQNEIFYSNEKLKETIGYQPRFSIEKTLKDLLDSHRAMG